MNESARHRIAGDEDNWDRFGSSLERLHSLKSFSHDHVRPAKDELGSQGLERFGFVARVECYERVGRAFHIAELAHPPVEVRHQSRCRHQTKPTYLLHPRDSRSLCRYRRKHESECEN